MRIPIGFLIFLTLILGAAITFAAVYQKSKRPVLPVSKITTSSDFHLCGRESRSGSEIGRTSCRIGSEIRR